MMLRGAAVLVVCCGIGGIAEAQEIIAHRGASHDAPENTLSAFRLAWEQKADGVEGDFRLTADGRVVCMHDATTDRTTGGEANLEVAHATLKELRALDVGMWKGAGFAGERIPTLAEVLEVIEPGKKLYLEIKGGPELVEPIRNVIAESDLEPEQIVVIAFNAETVARTRQLLPKLRAFWLVSYEQDAETGRWLPPIDQVLATLERIDARGLSTHARTEVVDEAFVAALREAGYEFHTWTINDGELARRFQQLGVDSITTDRPGFIRNELD